jgi:hypothetical protein
VVTHTGRTFKAVLRRVQRRSLEAVLRVLRGYPLVKLLLEWGPVERDGADAKFFIRADVIVEGG